MELYSEEGDKVLYSERGGVLYSEEALRFKIVWAYNWE